MTDEQKEKAMIAGRRVAKAKQAISETVDTWPKHCRVDNDLQTEMACCVVAALSDEF